MTYVIIDCYTDEPSGLGVPPYIGTYPRYIYGKIKEEIKEIPYYLTIDDLRYYKKYNSKLKIIKPNEKTNISIYNLTKNFENVDKILKNAKQIIVIVGIHVPGKYLSAIPGTINEVSDYIKDYKALKILTGPSATSFGSGEIINKKKERKNLEVFDEVIPNYVEKYFDINKFSIIGAEIINQIRNFRIAEIETSRGCYRGKDGCSFCSEPLKHEVEFRNQKDIYNEVKALNNYNVDYFRLGKQSCFYSYKHGKINEIEKLLKPISKLNLKVLHIDNANPAMVNEERTKLIVKYCTPGNVCAFGVESFDEIVQKSNNLNSDNEITYNAVKIVNEIGGKIGNNGMYNLLPGINILFGLKSETKKTFEDNYFWLKKFLDEKLLLRRINIRKVTILPNTKMYLEDKGKTLKKNWKYYWKWRDKIRKDIDHEMLKILIPKGHILKDVYSEIYDGNNTFCRQIATYPLIIGVKKRLELNKFYNIKITSHMLRSITGEVVN
jgi:radical SAM superfamily enzyme with C-terminal helix-hairpin-helix motif